MKKKEKGLRLQFDRRELNGSFGSGPDNDRRIVGTFHQQHRCWLDLVLLFTPYFDTVEQHFCMSRTSGEKKYEGFIGSAVKPRFFGIKNCRFFVCLNEHLFTDFFLFSLRYQLH